MNIHHLVLTLQEFRQTKENPNCSMLYVSKDLQVQLGQDDYLCFHANNQHLLVKVKEIHSIDHEASDMTKQWHLAIIQPLVRVMEPKDYERRGYIHFHAWNETYTGLVDQPYLDMRSIEQCIQQARQYPDNTFVIELEDLIAGFACFHEAAENDLKQCGEISAIYLLAQFHHMGLGVLLMDACMHAMRRYLQIIVWVLCSNDQAIRFYESYGFQKDGTEKIIIAAKQFPLPVCRMMMMNPQYRNE